MKNFSRNIIVAFISLTLTVISCKIQQTTQSTRRLNLSFLYNPNVQTFKVDAIIHNTNDSISTVHCSIPLNNLFFLKYPEKELASITVNYKLYLLKKTFALYDSASFQRTIIKEDDKLNEYFTFNINTRDTGTYVLDLYIVDKNTNVPFRNYYNIERTKKYNDNDFLLINKKGIPYFKPWVTDTDTFYIKLREKLPAEWKFAWFPNTFKQCMPPYSITTNKDFIIPMPDSIRVKLISDSSCFVLSNKSILHIYRDSIGNGKTIFNFSNEYPSFVRPSELLQPLRLMTTQKEFNELNTLKDKKEAVDRFWLNSAKNPDRARELIKVFYTRVMYANKYFTSYTEGWKTDRGMIYIIYGIPTTLYKGPSVEQWIYGTPESNKVLIFNFIKNYHPFSNNHYILERNESYKISWLQAVDTWRNGKIFSIINE